MPSKYVAKNPRAPKVDMADTALLARRAMAAASEIRAARYRLQLAALKRVLKGMSQHQTIEAICYYLQIDELDQIVFDLKAKQRRADALAAKNRHRQAS